MPRISVVIPVLNAEDYVASALRSVMAQSVEDFGITVVDDCSDDASRAISVRTLEQTKNVTVISTPRRMGVAGALNLGISHSDSEFIARLDADDLMSRNRLEQQLRRMQEEPRLGLLGTWIKTFGMRNRKIRFPTSHNGILAEMSLRNCIAHPSVMIRREAVEKFSTVFDPSFTNTEDWDLWERISHHYRLGNLPAFLTSYRLHNSQVSRAAAPEIDAKEEEIRNRFFATVGWSMIWRGQEVRLMRTIAHIYRNRRSSSVPLRFLFKTAIRAKIISAKRRYLTKRKR